MLNVFDCSAYMKIFCSAFVLVVVEELLFILTLSFYFILKFIELLFIHIVIC